MNTRQLAKIIGQLTMDAGELSGSSVQVLDGQKVAMILANRIDTIANRMIEAANAFIKLMPSEEITLASTPSTPAEPLLDTKPKDG